MQLVLDWDGTATEVDTLHMVLGRFGDIGVFKRAEETLGRRLTLREVLVAEFETVTAPLEEVVGWLVEHARIRAGFRELVERHDPLVLSSGFHELIEPILEREGIEVPLLANRLEARPDGWRLHWRDETICTVCGMECKRGALGEEVVYVGDGFSDNCAALAASRVFARDNLARYLDEQGVPYERFETLHDVARALA
jgi:2-hydroxy-3-keto-5-methylthiopentenyl-1-phosphate phosphatase